MRKRDRMVPLKNGAKQIEKQKNKKKKIKECIETISLDDASSASAFCTAHIIELVIL